MENTVKKTNISATGAPHREQRENGTEAIPKEMITENVPKLREEIKSQI